MDEGAWRRLTAGKEIEPGGEGIGELSSNPVRGWPTVVDEIKYRGLCRLSQIYRFKANLLGF